MTFNSDIEKTEAEIKVLQAKLDLLKEIETHKSQPRMNLGKVGKFETVSYNDEFYVRMDYSYDILWYKSKNTKNFISNNLTLITDGETHRLLEGLWFNQVKKGKYDEQPTNWEPKKQTPEEVAEGLRSAMMQAKEDGVFDTPKKGTLYDIIADWWDEIFINNNPSGQNIESIVDRIGRELLPETFQSYGEYQEGWNDCVENLRLKLK